MPCAHVRCPSDNRPCALSLPDSAFLLEAVVWDGAPVLNEMRNSRGAPNGVVRALALLLVLLLGGPLTVLLVRAAAKALDLAL